MKGLTNSDWSEFVDYQEFLLEIRRVQVSATYVRQSKKSDSTELNNWIDVRVKRDDQLYYSAAHGACPHPEHRKHQAVPNREQQTTDAIVARLLSEGWQVSELDAGDYYPRIWRGGKHFKNKTGEHYPLPYVDELPYLDSFVVALQQLEILFEDLTGVFGNVHPDSSNRTSFGSRIRNLLILASTEVECEWRAILEANGNTADRFTTNDYHKLSPILRLDEYNLSLRRYPHYPELCPFGGWDRAQPTKSLPWYHAYNEVKHDREGAFEKASLEHAVSAVGACVILLAAQFGPHSLKRFELRNIFEFVSVPVWPITQWYIDPVVGGSWRRVNFPF